MRYLLCKSDWIKCRLQLLAKINYNSKVFITVTVTEILFINCNFNCNWKKISNLNHTECVSMYAPRLIEMNDTVWLHDERRDVVFVRCHQEQSLSDRMTEWMNERGAGSNYDNLDVFIVLHGASKTVVIPAYFKVNKYLTLLLPHFSDGDKMTTKSFRAILIEPTIFFNFRHSGTLALRTVHYHFRRPITMPLPTYLLGKRFPHYYKLRGAAKICFLPEFFCGGQILQHFLSPIWPYVYRLAQFGSVTTLTEGWQWSRMQHSWKADKYEAHIFSRLRLTMMLENVRVINGWSWRSRHELVVSRNSIHSSLWWQRRLTVPYINPLIPHKT